MRKAAVAFGLLLALVPMSPAAADGIRDDQWHLQYLRVSEATEKTHGEGVTVAVVDYGVDRNHVDLAAAVLPPAYVDPSQTEPRAGFGADPGGHGTALAGLIAGQGHGAAREHGVLGLATGAQVLPVVLAGSPSGEPGSEQLAEGIEVAAQRGAKVIVVGYSVSGSERLGQAVRLAQAAGAIIVAADGNRPGEAFEPYPAGYDGVLAAIPLSHLGEVLVASDSGRRSGFGVPGEEIMTTNTGGGYRIDAGSAAAGILAGAVALVRSAYPELPAEEIVHRLAVTAADAGAAGPDPRFGLGRLDLVPALTRTVPLLHPPAPPSSEATPPAAVSAPAVAAPADPRSRGAWGWLLGVPLIVFIAVLVGCAWRAERRLRGSAADGIDSAGASS